MTSTIVRQIICLIIYAYLIVLIVRAVMSWFPIGYDSPMRKVRGGLDTITEPLLAPLRRVIPPVQLGGVGLDMSFMVLFFGIVIIQLFVCR